MFAIATFVGSQFLARASSGSIRYFDTAACLIGTLIILLLSFPTQRLTRRLVPRVDTGIMKRVPSTVAVPLIVILFTLIPTVERQGYGYLVMSLRMLIGVLIILQTQRNVPSWLALSAIVTIVFHTWLQPTAVTAIFVGAALVVLGLHNMTQEQTLGSTGSGSLLTTATGTAANSTVINSKVSNGGSLNGALNGALDGGVSAGRAQRGQWNVLLLVAISLLGALLLAPIAKHWAIRPNANSTSNIGLGGGPQRPTQTFGGLKRSKSLKLAYRPTNSTEKVLDVYTYAEAPVFLRSQTFDGWDGKTWSQVIAPKIEPTTSIGSWDARPRGVDVVRRHVLTRNYQPGTKTFDATVTYVRAAVLLQDLIPTPIEAFGGVWTIDRDDASRANVDWLNDGTAISRGENLTDYSIIHNEPEVSAIDLANTYLLDAKKFSSEVTALAKKIAGDASTPEEKTNRIRQWVSSNIKYNLLAKEPNASQDPVDFLLFKSREGSCTHFATATVALLRSVGVPARIATGFVAQEQPSEGLFIVRGKDAHAWAEVPMTAGGWIEVDTTLGARVVPPPPPTRIPWRNLLLFIGVLIVIALGCLLLQRLLRRKSLRSPESIARSLQKSATTLGLRFDHTTSMRRLCESLDSVLATDITTGLPSSRWTAGELTLRGREWEAAQFGKSPQRIDGGQTCERARIRARQVRAERRLAQRRASRTRLTLRIRSFPGRLRTMVRSPLRRGRS
jgi:transglutaminase-like putative cysteine protease